MKFSTNSWSILPAYLKSCKFLHFTCEIHNNNKSIFLHPVIIWFKIANGTSPLTVGRNLKEDIFPYSIGRNQLPGVWRLFDSHIPGSWFLNPEAKILDFNVNKQSVQTDIYNEQHFLQRQVNKLTLVSINQFSVQLCRYLGVGNPLPTTHTVEHIGSIINNGWWSYQIRLLFEYKLK